MNNKTSRNNSLPGVILVSMLSVASAFAQQALEFTDTDNDGVISATEIKFTMQEYKWDMLAQFDVDGNGELSRAERQAMKNARYDAALLQFDADGDGELSSDERQSSREARRMLIERQLDVNQDGKVSSEEGAGFAEVRSERRGGDGNHRHGAEKGGKDASTGRRGGYGRGERHNRI